MKLLINAKENFLQTSIAVLAIGAGVFMPTVEALKGNTELLMFFSIFGAFGGAMLSKALEGTSAIEERVSKRFSERLNPINRHLASLAKEMTAIIRGAESNQTTPHEAMKLIEQLTPNLIGAMTDIE
ncbi:hypothetical protein [Propionivibrio sp.]|uniref:hypothetical protein n=1 Tax=Propionivibrio sp. TaxID=2212460 RepID=UPI0025DB2F50|nr:hypothetical protein [Propionivibrio sp.]MBK7356305.1 hypothetical protein [Propionivibrio sp.]